METVYLKEFILVSELGSFNEAAAALFTSQSSVSRHIIQLETSLGHALLERTNKGVTVNAFGKSFLAYARRIMQAEENCRLELQAIEGSAPVEANIISVGCDYNMKIFRLIQSFERKYPGRFVVNQTSTLCGKSIQLLENGTVELAFARYRDISGMELGSISYSKEPLLAFVSDRHPLAEQKEIRLENLKDEPFIMLEKGSSRAQNSAMMCRRAGFEPRIVAYANVINGINLVKRGLGIMLFFDDPENFEMEHGIKLIKIAPEMTIQGFICYRRWEDLSIGAQLFVNYLKGLAIDS